MAGSRMSNEAGVEALKKVRSVIGSFGPPMALRKFYGVLNAIEMQIEDDHYSVEAVQYLGKALGAIAMLYRLDMVKRAQLVKAWETFVGTLGKT